MPRGSKPGERRGGRKKGTPNKRKLEVPSPEGETTLQYLHRLMRDGAVDPVRRDWAAKMAVRFEPKPGSRAQLGKKAAAEEAARTAGEGSNWAFLEDWGNDLDPDSKN